MSPSIDFRENREFAAEMKFVVSPETGEKICAWARTHLDPDPNGNGDAEDEYRITSLYFDTEGFDVFRRNGSFGRSKFRIRKYGASEQVFLERKLKTRGLVAKRRSLVPAGELPWLGGENRNGAWRGTWYQRRIVLRQLRPVCQIAYERTARVGRSEQGPIRLTIDRQLRAVPVQEIEFLEDPGQPVAPEHLIVEMKYRAVFPALFKGLVETFALTPAAISKYRLSVRQLGLAPAEILDSEAGPVKTPAYA